MNSIKLACLTVVACASAGLIGCEKSTPAPASAGSGNPIDRLSESPNSLLGKSAQTARNTARAATSAQDSVVGAAQEMSGEARAVEVAGLRWSAPTVWEKVTPTSSMRAAELKVTSDAGNGEGSVAFFANVGGDARSNIERWRGQFAGAGGTPPQADILERTIAGSKVWLVSIKGLAVGGQPGGPAVDTPDYGLRGAIIEGPNGMVFIKFQGPEALMVEHESAWKTMVNGMRKQ